MDELIPVVYRASCTLKVNLVGSTSSWYITYFKDVSGTYPDRFVLRDEDEFNKSCNPLCEEFIEYLPKE